MTTYEQCVEGGREDRALVEQADIRLSVIALQVKRSREYGCTLKAWANALGISATRAGQLAQAAEVNERLAAAGVLTRGQS
jgi:hypothetical protein